MLCDYSFTQSIDSQTIPLLYCTCMAPNVTMDYIISLHQHDPTAARLAHILHALAGAMELRRPPIPSLDILRRYLRAMRKNRKTLAYIKRRREQKAADAAGPVQPTGPVAQRAFAIYEIRKAIMSHIPPSQLLTSFAHLDRTTHAMIQELLRTPPRNSALMIYKPFWNDHHRRFVLARILEQRLPVWFHKVGPTITSASFDMFAWPQDGATAHLPESVAHPRASWRAMPVASPPIRRLDLHIYGALYPGLGMIARLDFGADGGCLRAGDLFEIARTNPRGFLKRLRLPVWGRKPNASNWGPMMHQEQMWAALDQGLAVYQVNVRSDIVVRDIPSGESQRLGCILDKALVGLACCRDWTSTDLDKSRWVEALEVMGREVAIQTVVKALCGG